MLNFRKLENTIVGSLNGKPFNIVRTENAENYLTEAKDKLAKGECTAQDVFAELEKIRLGEIAGSNKYLIFNPVSKEYFLNFDGKRSKHPIPEKLVELIQQSFDKDIDFMPIIKAWVRLLNNPRYNKTMGEYFATYLEAEYTDEKAAEKMAEENEIDIETARNICTYPDISVSEEGLLVTYKVAEIVDWEWVQKHDEENDSYTKVMKKKYKTIPAKIDSTTGAVLEPESYEKPDNLEDYLFTPAICKSGDLFYSGQQLGYVYQIGQMQHLPKKALRNLSNTFGGGGLYSGGLTYIENYGNDNTKTLVCFVNPGDLISFQSEGRAFRTDAIFPNNVWDIDVPLKNIYHSSDYDKLSTERLDGLMAEAMKDGVDIAEEQAKYVGGITHDNVND